MSKYDWSIYEKEYLKGKTTYHKIADKYNIPRKVVEEMARKQGWYKKKKELEKKAREKTRKKVLNNLSEKLYQEQERNFNIATKLINQIEKSLQDTQQYTKRVMKLKKGFDEEIKVQETGVLDTKALLDASKALSELTQLQRTLCDAIDTKDKLKLEIEKEKLEIQKESLDIQKAKAGIADGDDEQTGVLLLPEVELIEEGAENDG